jgi:hypothetical protein
VQPDFSLTFGKKELTICRDRLPEYWRAGSAPGFADIELRCHDGPGYGAKTSRTGEADPLFAIPGTRSELEPLAIEWRVDLASAVDCAGCFMRGLIRPHSLKTERTIRRIYRTCDEAKANVFDYIKRFYNPKRTQGVISAEWSLKCRRNQLRVVSTRRVRARIPTYATQIEHMC